METVYYVLFAICFMSNFFFNSQVTYIVEASKATRTVLLLPHSIHYCNLFVCST